MPSTLGHSRKISPQGACVILWFPPSGKTALGNIWYLFRLTTAAPSPSSQWHQFSSGTRSFDKAICVFGFSSQPFASPITPLTPSEITWFTQFTKVMCMNHQVSIKWFRDSQSKEAGRDHQRSSGATSHSKGVHWRKEAQDSSAWVLNLWHGDRTVSAGLWEEKKYTFSYRKIYLQL